MKIIDKYILKRFILTFVFTLLVLIPIAVVIDISEKVDKFLRHENLTVLEIIQDYYLNFIVYYGNTFMPLALFLAVIIFTSRLANNTEIIAVNDAQVSFTRFLYPYFLGATMITIFSLLINHFILPISNKQRKSFEHKYFHKETYKDYSIKDFNLQLDDSTYVYFKNFNLKRNIGYNFSYNQYRGLELKTKLTADRIQWNPKDSTYNLFGWKKRIITLKNDSLTSGLSLKKNFDFSPKDFLYKKSFAQEMPTIQLKEYIKISQKRGVKNLNAYWVELYKRTSLPIASYILTFIAIALSYKKRRGGIGVNLAIGVSVMFVYVFFLKVSEVLGAVAGANSFINVWMPNLVFGIYAIYLYFNARK